MNGRELKEDPSEAEKDAGRVMACIIRGQKLSARRDWIALGLLHKSGLLTSRVAENGQLEYLHNGKPVRVGP